MYSPSFRAPGQHNVLSRCRPNEGEQDPGFGCLGIDDDVRPDGAIVLLFVRMAIAGRRTPSASFKLADVSHAIRPFIDRSRSRTFPLRAWRRSRTLWRKAGRHLDERDRVAPIRAVTPVVAHERSSPGTSLNVPT